MATQEWDSQGQERGLDSGSCLKTLTLFRVRALMHNPSTQKDIQVGHKDVGGHGFSVFPIKAPGFIGKHGFLCPLVSLCPPCFKDPPSPVFICGMLDALQHGCPSGFHPTWLSLTTPSSMAASSLSPFSLAQHAVQVLTRWATLDS
jgi:hypothetical protein